MLKQLFSKKKPRIDYNVHDVLESMQDLKILTVFLTDYT